MNRRQVSQCAWIVFGLLGCQPASQSDSRFTDDVKVEGTNLEQAVVDGNGMAQNGMGKNGMGQNGMAKNGMAKNGMGKNGMAQNGMGKNGLDSSSSNYESDGGWEFAFLNGFYYSELFSNASLRDQLFKNSLSNDLDTNASRVELKRLVYRGLRVASWLTEGGDWRQMGPAEWNALLFTNFSDHNEAQVYAGKVLWSAIVFDYLVRAASAADVTLNFPVAFLTRTENRILYTSAADTFTFAKQQALCNSAGKWGTTGAIDEPCAKIVSAYLSTVNNGSVDSQGNTVHVPISVRNPVTNSGPTTLNPTHYATRVPQFPYRKGQGRNVNSSLVCQATDTKTGLTRDCGWQQGDAFVCKKRSERYH